MDDFQTKFDTAIADYATKNQYNISKIPYHVHNGTDSPLVVGVGSSINGKVSGTSTTTIANLTETKLTPTTKEFANGITWDATNYRFVIITPGQYQINAQVAWSSVTAEKLYYTGIAKNGAMTNGVYGFFQAGANATNVECYAMSDILNLVAGDYIELHCEQTSGGNQTVYNNPNITYLSIAKV